jgi:hypothetical protein
MEAVVAGCGWDAILAMDRWTIGGHLLARTNVGPRVPKPCVHVVESVSSAQKNGFCRWAHGVGKMTWGDKAITILAERLRNIVISMALPSFWSSDDLTGAVSPA